MRNGAQMAPDGRFWEFFSSKNEFRDQVAPGLLFPSPLLASFSLLSSPLAFVRFFLSSLRFLPPNCCVARRGP